MRAERPLRIAIVSTLWEQVPPKVYGGIELVVSLQADGLVKRGHDVTLFAAGDALTEAKLEPACPLALRHDPESENLSLWHLFRKNRALEMGQLQKVYARADQFDVIHSHSELFPLPFAKHSTTPTVHTLHMDLSPAAGALFAQYPDQGLISISDAQRDPFPELNYIRTVYNAIDVAKHPFSETPQSPPYLAFLGRLSLEKGVLDAVKVAKQVGLPLKIAGKLGKEDESFYAQNVEPLIDGEQICYIGEVSNEEKMELLRHAAVTLFPVNWREPFGLVMIESMACGTPVIGLCNGSVPEVIEHGKTGFVCQNVEEIVNAVPKAMALSRQYCRDYVERRFGIQQMLEGYEDAYQQAILNKQAVS
ncbi:glycosyltransferase family 4 protein [Leptothoe sp. PORK10 BA2]|uniref:glycosyltransferase family 4 protein n=1 Tax=Leptothoe sp. PORK10 BA2 TaxID=3110254 RepID=UPI002B202028|nr:glycosyltransferase family 4 protein [Leptothoe sp. PORK10 BA2]MEA5465778.1 glycosyltransferase family 4 protein [Leptothoe sp. PORK10 BA2]